MTTPIRNKIAHDPLPQRVKITSCNTIDNFLNVVDDNWYVPHDWCNLMVHSNGKGNNTSHLALLRQIKKQAIIPPGNYTHATYIIFSEDRGAIYTTAQVFFYTP